MFRRRLIYTHQNGNINLLQIINRRELGVDSWADTFDRETAQTPQKPQPLNSEAQKKVVLKNLPEPTKPYFL